jgi:cell wall-associated NlpC family hydrolase
VSDYASTGRHRSPGRYSPLSELSVIVSRAGESSVKASAVLAASGGLVAAFALPATAATGASAPERKAPRAPASAAPAVVAPEAAVPVKAETVGALGFRAVAKPKPKPQPQAIVSRTVVASLSRSAVRAPIVNIPQSSSAIVNIARGLFGIPYVYGGESLSGFDCSGFTQYVYRQAGISIPRTASAQQAAAARVSSPQPGDLVFFGYPAYHVGIYVGKGMMIDAAHSGTVTAVRAIYSGVSGYGRF